MSDSEKTPPEPSETGDLPADAGTGQSNSVPSLAEIIAQRLRIARIAAGLTQQELAGNEFSKSYISALERGKMIPSIQALDRLARRLGVTIGFLLGETIPPPTLSEQERAVREKAATLQLGHAEALLRQDQPHAAWEVLGAEPTDLLSMQQRVTWYWLAGWALRLIGRPEEAVHFLKRGLNLAEPLLHQGPDDQQEQLRQLVEWLHCFLAMALCAQDQMYLALLEYRRGLDAIGEQRITDLEFKFLVYKGLGSMYLTLGRYSEAITYYKRAVKQAVDLNDLLQLASAYWGLGIAYQESDDLDSAWEAYQDALQILEGQKNWRLAAKIRVLLGEVLTKLRYYEEAEEQVRESLTGAQQLGDSHTVGNAMLILAALHLAKSKPENAIEAINEGMLQMGQKVDPLTEGQFYLKLAEAHTAQRNSAATEQSLKLAIKILEPTQLQLMLDQAHERYARFLAEQGRFQEAYAEICLACLMTAR